MLVMLTSLAKALNDQLVNGCNEQSRKKARDFVISYGNLTRMVEQYYTLYQGGAL